METWDILAITDAFLDQNRINVCERVVKWHHMSVSEKCHQGFAGKGGEDGGKIKWKLSEVNARAVSWGQDELVGRFKMELCSRQSPGINLHLMFPPNSLLPVSQLPGGTENSHGTILLCVHIHLLSSDRDRRLWLPIYLKFLRVCVRVYFQLERSSHFSGEISLSFHLFNNYIINTAKVNTYDKHFVDKKEKKSNSKNCIRNINNLAILKNETMYTKFIFCPTYNHEFRLFREFNTLKVKKMQY